MEHEIDSILESILFASGDPVPVSRLCALLDKEEEEILEAAQRLADGYSFERRGIRLLRLEDSLQLCSAPENGEYVRRALEARKPPRLSAAAMEVLTLVAYFQPVTKTYIEQIRGVDSSYTVSLLVDRELIELRQTGRTRSPHHLPHNCGFPASFRSVISGRSARAGGTASEYSYDRYCPR